MLSLATRTARFDACKAPGRFALLSTVGSRAYGTHNEDSDWDFKGVYVASHQVMFSLGGAPQTLTPESQFDMTVYELAHFCKLAAAANPTVLEILWADEYEASDLGERLRAHRDLFLSKRILQTYGGYAKSQVRKALDGTGGSRGADHHKRRKFRLHTVRLLHCGEIALRDGRVPVRLREDEVSYLNAMADLPDEQFASVVDEHFETMDLMAARSPLRDKPYEPDINRLMYSMRQSMLP